VVILFLEINKNHTVLNAANKEGGKAHGPDILSKIRLHSAHNEQLFYNDGESSSSHTKVQATIFALFLQSL
jgi:hypothetical protein